MPKEQSQNKKVAFIDRDGVINKKAPDHSYILNKESFIFNKGIFKTLTSLANNGFEFIIITNQRGISRGLLSEIKLKEIHQLMEETLANNGIKILDILYCPHASDTCDCRKPRPGLLEKACAKYNIDLSKSILISDSKEDITMGKEFGLGSCHLVPLDKPEMFLETYDKKIT